MKSKNIKKVLIILVPVFLVAMLVTAYYTSPAYKTTQAIKNNDCQQATLYYQNVRGSIQNGLLGMLLPSALDSVNERFNSGQLTLDETENIYHTVTSFECTVDISTQQKAFTELKTSKKFWKIADDAMSRNDYATAIEYYQMVSEKDCLYDTVQTKLQDANYKYQCEFEKIFYSCLLKNDVEGATAFLNNALAVLPTPDLEAKREYLSSGVYSKALQLLNNSDEWETIEQSHAGPNKYCCYNISLSQGNPDIFYCRYVAISANSLVQSGHVNSIAGPVSWYKIDHGKISDLSYDEEKELQKAHGISWNYAATRIEKLKKLELLFS